MGRRFSFAPERKALLGERRPSAAELKKDAEPRSWNGKACGIVSICSLRRISTKLSGWRPRATSEWVASSVDRRMKKDGGVERFRVWVVTDGRTTKYLAMRESQAVAFARSYNELVGDETERLRVEERSAVLQAALPR
jgi:hypothetical protein